MESSYLVIFSEKCTQDVTLTRKRWSIMRLHQSMILPRLLLILFIWIIKATLPYMSSIEVPTYEILPSFNSFVLSNLTFMKFILNTLKFAVGVSMYWGFLSEKLVVPVPPNKDSDQFLLVFISLCSFSNTLSQWRGSEMHMLIHFTEQWTAGPPSLPCWLTNKQA